MIRFKKVQLVTMGAIIGLGLFNPFTVEVLNEYFKLFYTGVFMVCAVWVCGFILYKSFKPEKVNVPSKTSKTKPQKYLAV